jgi:hypothetical protein
MSRVAPPRAVPVTRAFEPTRLAEDALRGVYRLLVGAPATKIVTPTVRAAPAAVQGKEGMRP